MVGLIASDNEFIVVDDNEADLRIAKRCYDKSGLTNPWKTFSNGEAFLSYMAEVKIGIASMPACVLLDINMPGRTGLEILSAIKEDPFFKDRPIFAILTTSANERDKSMAAQLGANDFFTKPDNLDDYIHLFSSLKGTNLVAPSRSAEA
jgi:CheY-like chemotaxis protein